MYASKLSQDHSSLPCRTCRDQRRALWLRSFAHKLNLKTVAISFPMAWSGVIIFPTQTMHYYKEDPSKLPYICYLFDLPTNKSHSKFPQDYCLDSSKITAKKTACPTKRPVHLSTSPWPLCDKKFRRQPSNWDTTCQLPPKKIRSNNGIDWWVGMERCVFSFRFFFSNEFWDDYFLRILA